MHIMFIALGIIFLGIGLSIFLYVKNAQKNWVEAKADIIHVEKHTYHSSKNGHRSESTSYRITYSYLYNNTTYDATRSSSSPEFVGNAVNILINPNKPTSIYVVGYNDIPHAYVMMGIGLVSLIIGIIIFLY